MKKKIIGIVICSLLIIGIIVLLICNFAGAFAKSEETNCVAIVEEQKQLYAIADNNLYMRPKIVGQSNTDATTNITWGYTRRYTPMFARPDEEVNNTNLASLYISDSETTQTFNPKNFRYFTTPPLNLNYSVIPNPEMTIDGVTYYYKGTYQDSFGVYSDTNGYFNYSYKDYKERVGGTPTVYVIYGREKTIDINIYADTLLKFGDLAFHTEDTYHITLYEGQRFYFDSWATWTDDNTLPYGANVEISGITLRSQNSQGVYYTRNINNGDVVGLLGDEIKLAIPTLTLFDFGQLFDISNTDSYDEGYTAGYKRGNDDGYTSGYNNGYNAGNTDGYNQALEDIKNSSDVTSQQAALMAARNTLKAVASAFDVKLFGFLSVLDIAGIAVILGLVLFVIKLIRS